ncbi:hypothetical protein KC328_g125 [Hortaea werneckii]|nr:hypothetical protein KC328_g125 [Hortaea werneckii]
MHAPQPLSTLATRPTFRPLLAWVRTDEGAPELDEPYEGIDIIFVSNERICVSFVRKMVGCLGTSIAKASNTVETNPGKAGVVISRTKFE